MTCPVVSMLLFTECQAQICLGSVAAPMVNIPIRYGSASAKLIVMAMGVYSSYV